MTERRWPLVVALVVAVLLVAAAWAVGRATAPDTPAADGDTPRGAGAAVRTIDGVPVGVQQSRAGALAAADNYVARVTETVVQDPQAYERLVRAIWVPEGQEAALQRGERIRAQSPEAVANYAAGGRALAVVGARRVDSYTGSTAEITTWTGGFDWGPDKRPSQRWFLAETTLRWDGQRWRVESLEEATRPAPAPTIVAFDDPSARTSATFDRELRGMTAPFYGAGG
jgi:hypothetical protein